MSETIDIAAEAEALACGARVGRALPRGMGHRRVSLGWLRQVAGRIRQLEREPMPPAAQAASLLSPDMITGAIEAGLESGDSARVRVLCEALALHAQAGRFARDLMTSARTRSYIRSALR